MKPFVMKLDTSRENLCVCEAMKIDSWEKAESQAYSQRRHSNVAVVQIRIQLDETVAIHNST